MGSWNTAITVCRSLLKIVNFRFSNVFIYKLQPENCMSEFCVGEARVMRGKQNWVKCSKNNFVLSHFLQTALKMNEIILWCYSCSNIKRIVLMATLLFELHLLLLENGKIFHWNKIGSVFAPCYTTELIRVPLSLCTVLYFLRKFLLHNLKLISQRYLETSTFVLNMSPCIVQPNPNFSNYETK